MTSRLYLSEEKTLRLKKLLGHLEDFYSQESGSILSLHVTRKNLKMKKLVQNLIFLIAGTSLARECKKEIKKIMGELQEAYALEGPLAEERI